MNLGEELYLLALDPATGKVHSQTELILDLGLQWILVKDLELLGKLRIQGLIPKLNDTTPTSDPLLDGMLDHLMRWKFPFLNLKVRERIQSQLVRRETLIVIGRGMIGLPKAIPKDAKVISDIKDRVRRAMLEDGDIDHRTLALCEFAKAARLFPVIFTAEEISKARLRLRDFITTSPPTYPDKQVMNLWSEAEEAFEKKNLDRFFHKAFTVLEKVIEKEYCKLIKAGPKSVEFHKKVEKLSEERIINGDTSRILEVRKWRNTFSHEGADLQKTHAEAVIDTIQHLFQDVSTSSSA